MKGVETMPVKLILVCFLLLIVVSVGFYQISTFLNFKSQKEFKESLTSLTQQMKILKSSGDQGAFTGTMLNVPAPYKILLNLDNDTIVGEMGTENYTLNLTNAAINIIAYRGKGSDSAVIRNGTVVLREGMYDIRVYFGDLEDERVKEVMLLFL